MDEYTNYAYTLIAMTVFSVISEVTDTIIN